MKGLYKYPQDAYPYERLIREVFQFLSSQVLNRFQNAKRGKHEPEFELLDTGIFDDNRYYDVFAEYAKATPDGRRAQLGLSFICFSNCQHSA